MKPLEAGDPTSLGDGRYRLTGRLGQGGMGVVYFGRSRSGRAVAVKVVRPELSTDPGFRRRFADEVAAARRVGGFHTAPVVDADPVGEPAWLVTAYVPGPTLHAVLADVGALPLDTLTVLAAGLAEALEAIHRAGVIHRDLKPANIIVAEDGPRVIDFGIARALDGTGVTQTGFQIGTPGFLAPEQLTGGAITGAVDMFALGVVLSQAAGAAPFGDGPSAARHYRVVHEEADLGGVPDELRDLIAACLSKDPLRRPSPAGFLSRLTVRHHADGDWLPAEATAMLPRVEPAPAADPRAAHPLTVKAAPPDGGFGPAAPSAYEPQQGEAVPGGQFGAATPQPPYEQPRTYRPTERVEPAGGPYAAAQSYRPTTPYEEPPGYGPAGVPPTGPVPPPRRRRKVASGAAILVAVAVVAALLVWRPWAGGSTNSGSTSGGSPSSPAAGGNAAAALPTAPLLVRMDTAPGWPKTCHGVIGIRDAATDNPRQIVTGGTCDVLPAWAPDGSRFAFTRARPDGSQAAWVAGPDGSGARQVAAISGGRVSWSPDGTQLAVMRKKNGVTQLYTVKVADGTARQITTGSQSINDPAWSPDGSRIAICLESAPGLWQINLVNLSDPSAASSRITHGTERALDPVWSPDGRTFAYTYGKPGVGTQGDIHLVDVDGRNDRPLAAGPEEEMDPVWSRDGRWVAYVRGALETPAVWAIRADGTGTRKLTTGSTPEGHPSWR